MIPVNLDTASRPRHRWTLWHGVIAIVVVFICMLVTGNAWQDIFQLTQTDSESSHVLIVPFVVIWLVWVRRSRLRACRPDGRLAGSLMMAIGWVLWTTGYRRQIQSSWHFGALLFTVGGFVTVMGLDIVKRFFPAFLVLIFIIPVPSTARQPIALPLQRATAFATQYVGEILGLDVQRHANLLTVNGQDVAVAEACNGMRMIFTLFLASYVFAFVTPLRPFVRLIVLVMSPVTAITANLIRLVPTIWVFGHFPPSPTDTTAERFHDISGWVMLFVAFFGLSAIVRILRWATIPVAPFILAR